MKHILFSAVLMAVWLVNSFECKTIASEFVEPWQNWVKRPIESPLLMATDIKAGLNTSVTISVAGNTYTINGAGEDTSATNLFIPQLSPNEKYTLTASGTSLKQITINFYSYASRQLTTKRGAGSVVAPYFIYVNQLETNVFEAVYDYVSNTTTNLALEVRPDHGFRPAQYLPAEKQWNRDEDAITDYAPGDGFNVEIGPGRGTNTSDGAFRWAVNLGRLWNSRACGMIRLNEKNISSNLFSAAALSFTARTTNSSELQIITNSNGTLRQIRAPQTLVDITTNTQPNEQCILKFYLLSQIGDFNNGLYSILNDDPFVVWRIKNPNANGVYNRAQIIEERASDNRTNVSDIQFSSTSNLWQLTCGTGAEQIIETRTVAITNTMRQETVEIASRGVVSYKAVETYNHFDWGWELTNVVSNPGANGLTNSFTYYTNADDQITYRKIKDKWFPGGQWERTFYALGTECPGWPFEDRYIESTSGYSEIRIRPWKDGPANPDAASVENTVHTYQIGLGNYTFGHSSGYNYEFFGSPTNTEYTFGPSMTYMRSESEGKFGQNSEGVVLYADCVMEGNRDGVITTTYRHQGPGHYLDSQSHRIDYDDYRRDDYEYYPGVFNSATKAFTTNMVYGVDFMMLITHGSAVFANGTPYCNPQETLPNANYVHPGKSTQEMKIYNNGNKVFEKMFAFQDLDPNTGQSIFLPYESRVISYDSLGHMTNVIWIDAVNSNITRTLYQASWLGSNNKDCELKMWEINELGEKTVYAYDSLKRVTNCTHIGMSQLGTYPAQSDISTNTVYDSAGRIILQSISAGSLFQSQMTDYDKSGRIIKMSGMDEIATNISYNADCRVITETRPGGLTVVRSNYLDGRLKSVTGTAVVNQYYDYSITDNTQPEPVAWEYYYDYPKNVTRTYYATNSGSRWVENITNPYRLLCCKRYPGFGSFEGSTNLDQTYTHYGRKIYDKDTPTNTYNTLIIPHIEIHDYDGYGNEQGVQIGTQRYYHSDTMFEYIGGCWYSTYTEWRQDQYIGQNTNLVSRRRLSGYTSASVLYDATETDVYGNTNVITAYLNRSNKLLSTVTNSAQSTLNSTNIAVNGLLQLASSPTVANAARYAYDALGRLVSERDPLGYTVGNCYDPVTGLVLATTNKTGTIVTYEYYGTNSANAGKIKCQTDPTGKKTFYGYSNRGELIRIWGDVKYPEELVYDDYGDMTELHTYQGGSSWSGPDWPQTAPSPQTTRWSYHPATGLLLSKMDALGRSVTNNYLFTHTLRTKTNARGIVTTFTYDDYGYGDEIARDYSDGTPPIEWINFDPMGFPGTIKDSLGTRYMLYDCASRMTNIYWEFDSSLAMVNVGQRIDPLYGPDTEILANVYSNGVPWSVEMDWRYDAFRGRMSMVSNGVNAVIYSYATNSDLIEKTTSKVNSAFWLTANRSWDYGYRLRSIANVAGSVSVSSHSYIYDDLNRRTRAALADGSAWLYDYNARNEIVSVNRFWSDFTPVLGQTFGYQYDNIGNRTNSVMGGDLNGTGLWTNNYTVNALNQYSAILTPGLVAISGAGIATNAVQVNGNNATRKLEYYEWPLTVANASAALWETVTVTSGTSSSNGGFSCPKYQTNPTYDLDGNLTFDGVWQYQWDAENRLTMAAMTNITNVPDVQRKKLDFKYDYMGRRVMKTVSTWNGSQFANTATTWFVYDGWNLIAELDSSINLVRSYCWGSDLGGTMDGAGGIGGLVMIADYASGTSYFPVYDGNGNIMALVNAADQTVSAQYEYSPFGELIRATGPMAKTNSFRFSTKYWDEETGLVYYGNRYYSPALGRFINHDPIEEDGGYNLYAFINNNGVNGIDALGLMVDVAVSNGEGLDLDYSNAKQTLLTGGLALGFAGAVLYSAEIRNDEISDIIDSLGDDLNKYEFDDILLSSSITMGISSAVTFARGGKQKIRDSGLEDLTDDEIKEGSRDPNKTSAERRRFQKEEKARKLRERKKRLENY